VLVEVSHCGVCGSDLHMVIEGWGRKGSIGGHEWSGVIVAIGADVTGWAAGDEIVGGPTPRCGTCEPCRAGRPSLCEERDTPGTGGEFQGAFARYVKVDERELLRVPDGVSLREAALAEPLAVALHGVTLSGIQAGQRALVTGAGPIGALVIAALKAMGVDDIKVSEPSELRRELAKSLGASEVVTPDQLEDPGPFDPGKVVAEPVDVAFECSGNGAAMESCLAQLRRMGRLVLVGAGMADPHFNPNRILLNELVITGAFVYDQGGFVRALELLASGKLPNDLLVEQEDNPLNRLLDTALGLHEGTVAAKAMIVPRVD
jgi:threonine dehydrogenase-like Zn-dependent dehydrogenase